MNSPAILIAQAYAKRLALPAAWVDPAARSIRPQPNPHAHFVWITGRIGHIPKSSGNRHDYVTH